MTDRLDKIIKGLEAAGGGSFQLTLIDEGPDAGKWAVATVFGSEAAYSSMAAGSSVMVASSADTAVAFVLAETRWVEL